MKFLQDDDGLGFDFGGVICVQYDKSSTEDTSFFGKNFEATPQVEDAFESIALLGREGFRRRYVISKGSPPTQERTKVWLKKNGFYDITGLTPDDVYFCLDRYGKDPLARRLETKWYVDNDPRVLRLMKSVRHRFPFQSTAEHLQGFTPQDLGKFYPYVEVPVEQFKPLPDWKTTVKAILESRR